MRWDVETIGALYTALWALCFFLMGSVVVWAIVRTALQLLS